MGKKNTKYTLEQVRDMVQSKGFELISDEYVNYKTKMILKDEEGYYYETNVNYLLSDRIPRFVDKSNSFSIINIYYWCTLNNKPFELLSNNYEANSKKLQWKCFVKDCGEIFESTWSDIFHNRGCGFCDGKQVGISNCLASKNPQLTSEWHLVKNGDITPYNVTCHSHKEVWWQCTDKIKHIWKTTIKSRNDEGVGCPYCAGLYASEDYNLLVCNPELCEEWDYKRNMQIPSEYTPNSGKYAWWICKDGHKWKAKICDRNIGSGCSVCNESYGEKSISRCLKSNIIYFISQKKFIGLVGLGGGSLSYDFYLPYYNLLIEYQGQFHDGSSGEYSKINLKKQQEHDRRKCEYAKNNNIKLLEIWYWDYDNIEQILEKELNINRTNGSENTTVFL